MERRFRLIMGDQKRSLQGRILDLQNRIECWLQDKGLTLDTVDESCFAKQVSLIVPLEQELTVTFGKAVNEILHTIEMRLVEAEFFYGYFLLQMHVVWKWDLLTIVDMALKQRKFVLYVNPLLFLTQTPEQMETVLAQQVFHCVAQHPWRSKSLYKKYGLVITNMALDMVVNAHFTYLPTNAITVAQVNEVYDLALPMFETLEYYAERLHIAFRKEAQKAKRIKKDKEVVVSQQASQRRIEADEQQVHVEEGSTGKKHMGKSKEPSANSSEINEECLANQQIGLKDKMAKLNDYLLEKRADVIAQRHAMWFTSDSLEEEEVRAITEVYAKNAERGQLTGELADLVAKLHKKKAAWSWQSYLKQFMGRLQAEYRKTPVRRDRRQPHRLDISGRLRSHKARVMVALDSSGSMTDALYHQVLGELFHIVDGYGYELTVIECDSQVRRFYTVSHASQIRDRLPLHGGTAYTPVVSLANHQGVDILIYFTDGKGEERLAVKPRSYPIVWMLVGQQPTLSVKNPYGPVHNLPVEDREEILDFLDVERGGFSMANQE